MSTDKPDEQLLREFADGDRDALAALAERHEKRMLGFAYGFVSKRDPFAAEEAVQDAWIGVIRGAARFRADSSFKTWLYRILLNSCFRQGRRKQHDTQPLESNEIAACGAPYHDALEQSEWHARLRSVVATLPEQQRALVLLCFHHDLTRQQAADILAIPVGTLKSRLHATLAEIRTQLEPERIQ